MLNMLKVSAASILAKVSRDRFMVEISKDFKEFDFEKHKGYGTKAHIEAIKNLEEALFIELPTK